VHFHAENSVFYTEYLNIKWTNWRFMHEKVGVKKHCLTSHSKKWGVSWPPWLVLPRSMLGGSLYHAPKLHPGPSCHSCGRTAADRHTYHIRAWPQYILHRLRLAQNVIIHSTVISHGESCESAACPLWLETKSLTVFFSAGTAVCQCLATC